MRKDKAHASNLLHPIGSFGIQTAAPGEIRVERLEDRIVPRIPFPHRHDFFQLTLIAKGTGWHEIDFERHRVKNHSIFVMKTGQVHAWQMQAKGYVIEFTRESLPRFDSTALDLAAMIKLTPDLLPSDAASFSEIHLVCEFMLREFTQRRGRFQTCLQGHLYGLLARLLPTAAESRAKERTSPLTENFKELVEQFFSTHHRVEPYAEKLKVTPKALTMQLSRSLGKSARAVIQERILLEAKRLLVYSDKSVADIGYALGFDDPNYFTRFFSQQTGTSPARFRGKVK